MGDYIINMALVKVIAFNIGISDTFRGDNKIANGSVCLVS